MQLWDRIKGLGVNCGFDKLFFHRSGTAGSPSPPADARSQRSRAVGSCCNELRELAGFWR